RGAAIPCAERPARRPARNARRRLAHRPSASWYKREETGDVSRFPQDLNAMNARYGAVRRRRRTFVNLRTPLRMSLVALVIAALLAVPALALEVEAAIATAYALAVVEPHASNLGGEGYMVISLADGTEVAIDYRSRAPLHVNVHTPAETGWPPHGILTTLIPGMVKGTELALQKYGTMTLAEVLEPAIRLAEEGFPMGDLLASQIADAYESFLLEYPEAGKVFLDNMLIPEPGTIFRNPDLAHAMRLIAEHGSDVFY